MSKQNEQAIPTMPRAGHRAMFKGINFLEKAKNPKQTLKKLFLFYKIERRALILIFILLISSTLALLAVPTLIGMAINSINHDSSNYNYTTTIALIIATAYIIDWLCQTLQGWLMAGSSQRIVKALRHDLFDKMQRLPLTYHDAHSHGELMSRLTNDIDNISTTIAASTSGLMNALLTIVGALIFMLILSPTLTIVALITAPLAIILTKTVAKKSRVLFAQQQKELGRLNGIIEESISGLRMVKAFNQQEAIIETFDETNQILLTQVTKAQITAGFLMPMMNVISNLGFTLISLIGGIMATQGLIAIGTIASFITYNRFFVNPLISIAATFTMLQSALAGAERVFETLNEIEEAKDIDNAIPSHHFEGDVIFENVSFQYGTGKPILKNISFTVKKGETIALVGPTGAGKTTIVNLLTRFYDASSGTIYIDGNPITSYKRALLRDAFTVVLQDTYLFSGTIADNIKYAKPEATIQEIIDAAKKANSDKFIRRLKDGYHTVISGTINSLSEGQRQLIAISRAILHPAPILILDEATSSVDTTTELKIQEALLKFRTERTSFVIAHRLSTIKNADRIFVINEGEIIESGTHEALLKLNQVYAKMYYSQF